jgi:hypothetical protein
MPWSRAFEDPIPLPSGRTLQTLGDAASHIMALPGKTRQWDEWQAAIEALLMAAEDRGPLMHARIGMLRALNRHVERVFDRSRKDTQWGKRKLKRDEWPIAAHDSGDAADAFWFGRLSGDAATTENES